MADSGTYDQATILRRQRIAEQMLANAQPPQNMRSPWQGLSYLANTGADAFALNRLDKQAREARGADTAALMSLLGGGGTSPAPSPAAVSSIPAPSPSIVGGGAPASAEPRIYSQDERNPLDLPAGADRDLMIRTIQAEAGNQGPEGQRAVASVIRNRAVNGGYGGDTVPGVIKAPNQFEPVNTPAGQQRMAALSPDSPQYQKIGSAVDQAYAGNDPTNGALNFFAPKAQAALGRDVPAWAQGPGQDIGDHRFFGSPTAGAAPPPSNMVAGPGAPSGLPPVSPDAGPSPAPPPSGPAAVAQAMTPNAASPPAPAGALPASQANAQDPQRAAIARALATATPGSAAYNIAAQMAGQIAAPKNFTYQTLPDGTIIRMDPTGRTPPQPVYQAPLKKELKETGTDPLSGQKGFAVYDPATQTMKPMSGTASGAMPTEQTFGAIAAAKAAGAPQEELYKQVPESLRNGVKAMIEGKSIPTNLSMRGAARDATLKFAHAIDDTFDETLIPLRQTFAKSMGSMAISSFGGQVQSAGTIVKHLGGAADAFKTLEGSGALNETLPILNRPQLAAKGQSGDPKFNDAMGRWSVDSEAVAEELSRLLTGGVGAERTKQEWRDKLDIKSQPISKVKAALDEAAQVMMGRLSNVAQAKERAYQTPTDPISLLGPQEQKIMGRLKGDTVQNSAAGAPAPTSGPSRDEIAAEMKRRGLAP